MIKRLFQEVLIQRLAQKPNKIVLLFGPRQAGKTTLARQIINTLQGRILEINADDSALKEVLATHSMQHLSQLIKETDILFIDEAQRVPNIGLTLKLLHDHLPDLRIIATGSSSFDLANKTAEPLTGRTWTYNLLPVGYCELVEDGSTLLDMDLRLEELMIYGMYPGILLTESTSDKIELLRGLTQSYLYKDILEMGNLKNARKLQDLVKLLALQIGSEVSMNELSNALQIAKETVMNYIDLLEKAFVVFRLSGFSRNLRKEITRHDKIYFYDLGIRNALIENFNPLQFRNDSGQLWENFLIIERLKSLNYRREYANRYFWRTYSGAELDYVEERGGVINGFEFKFSEKSANAPESWKTNYPDATFQVINRTNYFDFIR